MADSLATAFRGVRLLLEPVVSAHQQAKVSRSKFLKDPFVDGYITGVITQFVQLPAQQQLTQRQRVKVYSQVFDWLTPTLPGIFGIIQMMVNPHPRQSYSKNSHPDWVVGVVNGKRFIGWKFNVDGVEQMPGVKEAIAEASERNQAEFLGLACACLYKHKKKLAASGNPVEALKGIVSDYVVEHVDPKDREKIEALDHFFWTTAAINLQKKYVDPDERVRIEAAEELSFAREVYEASELERTGKIPKPRVPTRDDVEKTLWFDEFISVIDERFTVAK